MLAATMPHAPFGVQPSNDVIALLGHVPPNPADALAVLFPPDQARALTAYVTRILRYRPQETVPVPTFVAQLGAVIGWSAGPGGDDPRRIHIPTLVAHGDSDRLIPPENARVLARRIPRARLLVYRDSAHGFLSQYASAFARRVNAFLR